MVKTILMKVVMIVLIVFCFGLAIGDDHSFFDSQVSTLTTANKLIYSNSLRDDALIDPYELNGNCNAACKAAIYYDSGEDACRFVGSTLLALSVGYPNELAIDSGVVFVQYETKFDADWVSIGPELGNCKFIRVRQDSVAGRADNRLFDNQLRSNYGSNVAGLPTLRTYDSGCDPISSPVPCSLNSDPTINDAQPGGDTNLSYYYYPVTTWIRETWEIDLDNGRVRYWVSDENNATSLIISDPSNTNLGYDFNNGSNIGLSYYGFGLNSSAGYGTSHTYEYWHRNFIVAKNLTAGELSNFISGQPGGEAVDTTAPTLVNAVVSGDSGGTILTLEFSEVCVGNDGFAITPSGGAASLVYLSGTGTSRIYTTSRSVQFNETVKIAYDSGIGNVIDAATNEMADFSEFNVVNTSIAGKSIVFSWDNTGHPEWGVKLYIGLAPGVYEWEHDAGVNVTETIVDNMVPGQTYYIVARVYDGNAYSGPSNELEVTIPSNVPGSLPPLPPL